MNRLLLSEKPQCLGKSALNNYLAVGIIGLLISIIFLTTTACAAGPTTSTTTGSTAEPTTGEATSETPILWDAEVVKAELSDLPEDYTTEQAVQDGCFVIVHGQLKSDLKIEADFIAKAAAGQPARLRFVQYTVEGDPVIAQVDYDGSNYHVVIDNTRDQYGSIEYEQFTFPCLVAFKQNNRQYVTLVNDGKWTIEEIMTRLHSSKTPDDAEAYSLYQYELK